MLSLAFRFLLAFAVTSITLSQPLLAAQPLKILNWEDYLSEEVIRQWSEESGVTIEQVHFDSDEVRDQILSTGKNRDFDLVMMDQLITPLFGENGTIERLDKARIPNLRHLNPANRDICSDYGLPYAWGTIGIVYRSDKVERPQSWQELLYPRESLKGHISILYDYLDSLIPPLILQGEQFTTEDTAALKQAYAALQQQIPSLLTLQYPITFLRNSSQAEELYMGMAYSGDQYVMNEIAGDESRWKYTVPEEGGAIWTDCLAVMAGSDNKAQAYDFLNYLQRPEIAAQNTEALYVATHNDAAAELLSPDFILDKEVFPSPEVMARSQHYRLISSDSVMLRKRITGAILKLHEAQ